MKKMKLVALSAVLCLVLGMTVNAEGSSAGGVQVSQETKTATVTKADGTKVENAAVVPVVKESSKAVAKEEAKKALKIDSDNFTSYTMDVYLAMAEDTSSVVTLADGSAAIEVAFSVPEVKASSKVVVLHWKGGATEPEQLPVTVEDGVVKAVFTSFSPVEILVYNGSENTPDNENTPKPSDPNKPGPSNGSGSSNSSGSGSTTTTASTGTSPKTADSSAVIYVAEALAVLSLAGAVICRKKSRA